MTEEKDRSGNEMSETIGTYHDKWFETMPRVFAVCGYRKEYGGGITPLQPVLFRKAGDAFEYMEGQMKGHTLVRDGGVRLKCFEIPVRDGPKPPEEIRCMICGGRMGMVCAYIDSPMHRPTYNICGDCVPVAFRTLKELTGSAERLAKGGNRE